jgi:hypothetical protein
MGQADTTQIELEEKIRMAASTGAPNISQLAVEGVDMTVVSQLLQQRRRVAELFICTPVAATENREMYRSLFSTYNEQLKQYLFL